MNNNQLNNNSGVIGLCVAIFIPTFIIMGCGCKWGRAHKHIEELRKNIIEKFNVKCKL